MIALGDEQQFSNTVYPYPKLLDKVSYFSQIV